jgi:Protein of unknown function (DUF3014)
MPDVSDYDLLRTEATDEPTRQRGPGTFVAAVLVIVAALVAAYLVYGRRPAPRPLDTTPKVAAADRPLGRGAQPVAVPPLDESDPIVRNLVRTITAHPAALAWLATNGLIRNFTLVVANVVDGETPARHLRVLRPPAPFSVIERGGDLVIDSRSYERYDAVAAAAASIDPEGASRTYATLKPRIEQAYAELGLQPASFDRALERAIAALLQVPVVDGPMRVQPKGIGYRYADPRLEQLTAAQKHLLRTGPRNVRAIHDALRRLALALGIPPERLTP